jgi:DNA invertase Pin-like site-specific DNA recombinase
MIRDGPVPSGYVAAAIYVRYSTGMQDSFADQIKGILRWVRKSDEKLWVSQDLIFGDPATTGKKVDRPAYQLMLQASQEGKFKCLLSFSTSRFGRDMCESITTAQKVLVPRGVRIVFQSPMLIDSNTSHWKMLHTFVTMIDDMSIDGSKDGIRAAQLSLFETGFQIGIPLFGYYGEPVSELKTKAGKPLRMVRVDPVAREVITTIFDLYVNRKIGFTAIARWLEKNGHEPPPYSRTRKWSLEMVRTILGREEYTGWFTYGESKSTFDPKADAYVLRPRDEPLRRKFFADRVIIPEELFLAAQVQTRARARKGQGGNRLRTLTRAQRPNLLHGLLFCPLHNRPLYSGGRDEANYYYLHCCRMHDDPKRALFSHANDITATRRICQAVSEILLKNERVAEQVVAHAKQLLETRGQPDPAVLENLEDQIKRINSRITRLMARVCANEHDQRSVDDAIEKLTLERDQLFLERKQRNREQKQDIRVPTSEEVRERLTHLTQLLEAGSSSGDELEQAAAKEIVRAVTGGMIRVEQRGERRMHAGWLVGKFRPDPMGLLRKEFNLPAGERTALDEACGHGEHSGEVEISFKTDTILETKGGEMLRLFEQGWSQAEVAKEFGCCRFTVGRAVQHYCTLNNLPLPDTNRSRANGCKRIMKLRYAHLAPRWAKANELYEAGKNGREIGETLGVTSTMGRKYVTRHRKAHGLPPPVFPSGGAGHRGRRKPPEELPKAG